MLINIQTLIDLTGFSHRKIKRIIQPVKPVKREGNSIFYESRQVLPLVYKNGDDLRKKKAEPAVGLPFNKGALNQTAEKARYLKAKADAEEIKVAKLKGELVPIVEVKATWGRIATSINRKLLALPDRLAQLSETVSTYEARCDAFTKEIHSTMTELSAGDFD